MSGSATDRRRISAAVADAAGLTTQSKCVGVQRRGQAKQAEQEALAKHGTPTPAEVAKAVEGRQR